LEIFIPGFKSSFSILKFDLNQFFISWFISNSAKRFFNLSQVWEEFFWPRSIFAEPFSILIQCVFWILISWFKSIFSSLEFDLNQVFILKIFFFDFNQVSQAKFLIWIKFWELKSSSRSIYFFGDPYLLIYINFCKEISWSKSRFDSWRFDLD
jgi:hypothetical protein